MEGTYILNSLQLNSGALVKMPETGNVVIYVIKDFQWKGKFTTTNYEDIAKRLKIYILGTGSMHIDADFAGQLIAPDGDVIIGQSGKSHYGSVYAKSIVLHQDTEFIWVPYVESTTSTTVARTKGIYNEEFF